MQGLRSRAGIAVVTAGAVALLSLPVVALGKGPPDLVGGGTDTAGTVVPPQAHVPDPPPGQLNRPDPASKPAPRADAEAPGQVSTPAPPAQAPSVRPPGPGRGASGHAQKRRGPKPAPPATPVGEPASEPVGGVPASDPVDGGAEPGGALDQPSPSGSPDEPEPTGARERLPSADAPDPDDGAVAGAVAGETVELPEDANPSTLPFTGFQLALLALTGLAFVAAGLRLRRTATR